MNTKLILQTVNTKGFCCSTTFKIIPNLKRIILPLYVNVLFKGNIVFDMNPIKPGNGVYTAIGMTECCMNEWVHILNYEYTPPTVTGKEEVFDPGKLLILKLFVP